LSVRGQAWPRDRRRKTGGKNKDLCLMGDGEQQEGQVWEAAMEAVTSLSTTSCVIDCTATDRRLGEKM